MATSCLFSAHSECVVSSFHGIVLIHIFFFKQKTAYEMRISDWSSDVCSSDLPEATKVTISPALTSSKPLTTAIPSPTLTTRPAPVKKSASAAGSRRFSSKCSKISFSKLDISFYKKQNNNKNYQTRFSKYAEGKRI